MEKKLTLRDLKVGDKFVIPDKKANNKIQVSKITYTKLDEKCENDSMGMAQCNVIGSNGITDKLYLAQWVARP